MPAQARDYYETLGVARTATPADIKKAFRKLARAHHPDTATDKKSSAGKFQEINEAHEVLSDPDKRKRFDERGHRWREEPGAFHSGPGDSSRHGHPFSNGPSYQGAGFTDFFSSHFQGGPTPPRARAGVDVEATLMVTLEEILTGPLRQVSLLRPARPGTPEHTDTYKVRVPAGVQAGHRIRLTGQGAPGLNGGPPGDLYMKVRLAPHAVFTVQGSDLHCDLPLAPWEAVLGAQVSVPSLEGGAANLRVPPGTASGSLLRMKGLGLPTDSGPRGDLLATVRVITPAAISPAEKVLWENLAAGSDFKARP